MICNLSMRHTIMYKLIKIIKTYLNWVRVHCYLPASEFKPDYSRFVGHYSLIILILALAPLSGDIFCRDSKQKPRSLSEKRGFCLP
jgi:hypothetical protein